MSSIIINMIINRRRRRRQRYNVALIMRNMRDGHNPFEETTEEMFKELYRFPKHLCLKLIEEIKPFMNVTSRINAIPCHIRVLSALRFFASGSYQRAVGQDILSSISQASVGRYVTEVSEAINKIVHLYVNIQKINKHANVKRTFFEIALFPGVIGLIDGTHIKIVSPPEIEHVYYCRKGGHSKNVQIVCDANYIIINVNARFGGTAHDSYVWRQSNFRRILHERYASGERNFWLLGDSGYPIQPWLMTPILTPTSQAEERYNFAHKMTRSLVERCIGVLKSRFRCLSAERTLCYSPIKAGKIINACVVLHNMLMQAKLPLPENIELDESFADNDDRVWTSLIYRILPMKEEQYRKV